MTEPQDNDALKAQVKAMALERFEALGLGLAKFHPAATFPPSGSWMNPVEAAKEGKKFIAIGGTGAGKTTAVKKMLWTLCLNRYRPTGGHVPTILHKIKSKGSDEFLDWMMRGDVLVLDDIDKMGGTRYEGEKFLMLLNHYDCYELPVLVTMNIPLADFRDRITSNGVPEDYASAILSRLQHNAQTMQFSNNNDHRLS